MIRTEEWRDQALCKGMDTAIFYPADTGEPGTLTEARRICTDCPVATDCLQYALDTREPHGIFGGLTPGQRNNLRRALQRRGRNAA